MRLVIAVLALVFAVLFAVQNTEVVRVSVLLWKVNASLAVIMVICLAIGLLVGLVALAPTIYRGRTDARRLRQQLAELDGFDGELGRANKQDLSGAERSNALAAARTKQTARQNPPAASATN